ncbi:MAG: hypothetical protein AAF798_09535 [Bacteroidota bacterium]
MRLTNVLFCLLCIQSLSAQYNTEFGIDLSPMIVTLTGNRLDHTNIELFYKEDTGEKDLRFRLGFTTSFQETEFVKRVSLEETSIFSYYLPQQIWAIDVGVAPHIKAKGIPLYYGVDVQLAFHMGDVYATSETCDLIDGNPACDILRSVGNTHYSIGLIPVLGTKLNLTERLVFTIEFGTQFNYRIGNYQYLDNENNWQKQSINGLEFLLDRGINDIALSYRF